MPVHRTVVVRPVVVAQPVAVAQAMGPTTSARFMVPHSSVVIGQGTPMAAVPSVLRPAPTPVRSHAPSIVNPPRRAVEPRQAEAKSGASNSQVIELLESLEARVDLMSQMQQTKAALQERARALHSNRESEYHGEYYREEVSYGGAYDGDVGGTTDDAGMYEYAQHADGEAWSYQQQEDYPVPTAHGQGGWNDIADHQQCISRLTGEVENMRQKLSNLERSAAIPTHDDLAMHGQHAYGYDVTAEDAYAPEPVPTEPLGSRFFQQHGRDLDDTQVVPGVPMSGASSLSAAMPMGTTTSAGPLPSVGDLLPAGPCGTTAGPLPRMARGPGSSPAPVAPFSGIMCGANLELTGDGYTVARTQGCRQAVAVGSAPLEPQAGGRYFEVVVEDTVAGWVGGLGIGVTATPPELAGRSPDKAWRMQKTFVIGYGGCIYLDGVERRTNWHPDTLAVGARVGLLVAEQGDGDIIVFVDGQPVVRMEGARLSAYDALYPVVDVFAATRSVSLCRWSSPPLPPWRIAAEPWAAGGSSGGSRPRSPSSASRTASACDGSQIGGMLRPAQWQH